MGKIKVKAYLPDTPFFRWKHVGIIASTEAIWRGIADETKNLLERRGVIVIFRTVEPSVNSDDVSIQIAEDICTKLEIIMRAWARVNLLYLCLCVSEAVPVSVPVYT